MLHLGGALCFYGSAFRDTFAAQFCVTHLGQENWTLADRSARREEPRIHGLSGKQYSFRRLTDNLSIRTDGIENIHFSIDRSVNTQ
jgi:hypothetical protein